jgi:hypothetical protein
MPDMQKRVSVLVNELLNRASRATDPDKELRNFLDFELTDLSPEERLSTLEALDRHFAADGHHKTTTVAAADEASLLMSRFLGRNFESEGLGQEEIFEKFAKYLDTLFDALNRINAVINQTLIGEEPELATIRKIIGSNIDGEGDVTSISEFLDRIQKSFLIAHTAFQEASSAILTQIMGELDPENLSKSLSSGLKFGALRKAELFDMYDEKFTKMKRWLESGQYKERLLRDFEKRCQREIGA